MKYPIPQLAFVYPLFAPDFYVKNQPYQQTQDHNQSIHQLTDSSLPPNIQLTLEHLKYLHILLTVL